MKSELITNKIEELIELARVEGEQSVQCILYAILGARAMGDEVLLANNVVAFIKTNLQPKAMQMLHNDYANKN